MIARIWHGWTSHDNAEAYEELLKTEVLEEIEQHAIQGFRGIQLLRNDLKDEVEFMTIMQFESIEAVKAFVGEGFEKAFVPDAAKAILKRFETEVKHYELRFEKKV